MAGPYPQPSATRQKWGLSPDFSAPPGVVSVKPGGVIDREALLDPLLEFTLIALDTGGLNSTASLTVTILDDNDNRPVFQPVSITARLRENSPPGEGGQQGHGGDPKDYVEPASDYRA